LWLTSRTFNGFAYSIYNAEHYSIETSFTLQFLVINLISLTDEKQANSLLEIIPDTNPLAV